MSAENKHIFREITVTLVPQYSSESNVVLIIDRIQFIDLL